MVGCSILLMGCAQQEVSGPLPDEVMQDLSPIEEMGGQFAREGQILSLAKLGLKEFPDLCDILTSEQQGQVKSLDMHTNDIQTIDVDLSCMTVLTEIDLSFNQLESIDGFGLVLKKLFLNQNNISSLSGLYMDASKLESLVMPHNKLNNLLGAERFENLINLEVYRNELVSLEGVEGLQKLEKIKLEFNKLTSVEVLDTLPNLGFVTAKYNQIDPEQLKVRQEKTEAYIAGKQTQ